MRDWLGDGLLLSAGQKWHTRRKLLTPSFHFDVLKSYHDTFNKTTNIFIECIKEKGEEKVRQLIYTWIADQCLRIRSENDCISVF